MRKEYPYECPGLQEEWTCPHYGERFYVDAEQLPMDGIINCPYCGREIKED